jgi:hypothetical protein
LDSSIGKHQKQIPASAPFFRIDALQKAHDLNLSTGAKLVDAIIEGVLSQDKAFFEGIVRLLLKKITQYWLKRPKKIVTTNFDPVLMATKVEKPSRCSIRPLAKGAFEPKASRKITGLGQTASFRKRSMYIGYKFHHVVSGIG